MSFAGAVVTPGRLRALLTTTSLTSGVTTVALPSALTAVRKLRKSLVLIASSAILSTTTISPLCRLGGQHALERETLDLLIQHIAVAAGLGGEHDTAVRPLGRAGAALTGTAGALLAPRLSAAAGNLSAGQSALRALTAVGKMIFDDLVNNAHVRLDAEDRVVQLDGTDFSAGHADNLNRRHLSSTPFLTYFWRKPSAGCGRKPSAGSC